MKLQYWSHFQRADFEAGHPLEETPTPHPPQEDLTHLLLGIGGGGECHGGGRMVGI